jgi:hypothetical protein
MVAWQHRTATVRERTQAQPSCLPVWRWLKQRVMNPLVRRLREDYRSFLLGPRIVLLVEAVLWYLTFMATLIAGMLYGTFGGGIREYLLWRKRLRTEGAGAAAERTP